MAEVGIENFIIGMLDKEGQVIKDDVTGLTKEGVFKADAGTSLGVASANITGLTATFQKIFGSNQVVDNQIGIPQPQVVLSTNNLPHKIYDKVVGREADGKGGYTSFTKAVPDVALLVTTQSVGTLKHIYIAFFGGNVAPGELNLQTNNTNEQRVADQLTFSANTRSKDGANYKVFYEDDDKFVYEEMMKEVFPGYGEPVTEEPGDDKDPDTDTGTTVEPEPVAKTIVLEPTELSVETEATADLGITVTGLDNKVVTFTPTDDTVATAKLDDESGKYQVTGIKEGTTDITVASTEDPTVKAIVKVTVTAKAV